MPAQERPVANGRLDIDTPLTLMAENATGLFSSPGLEGHRNGLDSSPVFIQLTWNIPKTL